MPFLADAAAAVGRYFLDGAIGSAGGGGALGRWRTITREILVSEAPSSNAHTYVAKAPIWVAISSVET